MSVLAPRANPELLGQERAAATLVRALTSKRLPHAWLLTGPRGIGKATLAFRFARRLLARGEHLPAEADLPPEHPLFHQVAQGAHPDLQVIEPPAETKGTRTRIEIGVEAVRTATTALHSTAAMGGRRVLIVDGADALNRNAANALLKPLEEPPRDAVLLLVAHDLRRVLPTIRSRCAVLRLDRLPDPVVLRILERQAPGLTPDAQRALARLARGSAGQALELAAGETLEAYGALASNIGAERVDALGLHDLAQQIARLADRQVAAPLALLQLLLARVVARATDRLDGTLFEGEEAALARLCERRTLDHWAALWEKSARLLARAESLNLDRSQVLLHVLTGMAASRPADGRPLGALPGGPDVVG